MPDNASLYDDDSDHESVRNELSPTDGYFNERHAQPQDVLVPDPSQSNTRNDKEREAREQLEASHAETQHTQAPESSRQQDIRQSPVHSPVTSPTQAHLPSPSSPPQTESTPLLVSAPPAYSPPAPDSPYHARNNSNNMGRPEAFFPNRDPEDLGGHQPLLGGDQRRRPWWQRAGDWIQEKQNKIMKAILLFLAILAGIGFIVNIVTSFKGHQQHSIDPHPIIPDPADNDIPHSCPSALAYSVDFSWNDPKLFRFLQLLTGVPTGDVAYTEVKNIGKLHIRPAPADAEDDILVKAAIHGNSHAVLKEFSFERNDESVGIYIPNAVPTFDSGIRPCIYLNVTLWIKPSVSLSLFHTQTQTLDTILYPGLEFATPDLSILTVANSIESISSPSSPHNSSFTGSRSIVIRTHSGAITGTYPLYDDLKLVSRSGSITAFVIPKSADPHRRRPAFLWVDSGSGSVRLNTPVLSSLNSSSSSSSSSSPDQSPLEADIPDRDYQTTIESHSGSITAQLLHGSRTDITSQSGHVQTDLTPYGDPNRRSYIKIETESGSIDTRVRGSASDPEAALRRLFVTFEYSTGSLTSRMPPAWEGKIRGKLLTGEANILWQGMQIDRYEREGPPWRSDSEEDDDGGAGNDPYAEYPKGGWHEIDGKGDEEDNTKLAEVETGSGDVHSEGWGWKILEGHKGRGEGIFKFESVTGSATLAG